MTKVVLKIERFFSLFLFRFSFFIKKVFVKIHSIYISRLLKHCGVNFHIEYPLLLNGSCFITIGDNFICNARLRLDAFKFDGIDPIIIIGNNVNINYDCHIGAINKIEIGNNVLIASKVFISDHSHGDTSIECLKLPPLKRSVISKGSIIIHDNVWIGEGASILSNVIIGEGAVIGTNAVVTKDVPPFSVVGGIPARILKSWNK